MIFCLHFSVKKTSLFLPGKRLSYIFSGLLIWMHYVSSQRDFLYTAGKGSETVVRIVVSEEN